MSNMEYAGVKIKLGKKYYNLRFDARAMNNIQHEFQRPVGDIAELMQDPIEGMGNLIKILCIMINSGIKYDNYINGTKDECLTEDIVGMLIDINDLRKRAGEIFKAVSEGTPEPEEGDGDPNPQSAQ